MTDPRYRYGRYQAFAYPTTGDIDSTESRDRDCDSSFSLRLLSVACRTLRLIAVVPATPDYVSDTPGALDSTHLDGAGLDMSDLETEEI